MRYSTRLALAVLAAGCMLLALSGAAGANRLSLTNQSIRWTFAEYSDTNAGIRISCEVTLEGSLHSASFAKVSGALIGYVNRASVRSPCRGEWGDMHFLTETLPWHMRYHAFAGTLPAITSATVDLVGWAWNYPGLGMGPCLYRSTPENPARWILGRERNGAITSVTADSTIAVRLFSGELSCASTINYEGTGSMTVAGSSTLVTLTLI